MHYRKSSPNPPRLLLRIVATAGAGALVGACSSGSGTESGHPCGSGFCGSAVMIPSDADVDGDAELRCGTGVCGSIGLPSSDAGEASVVGGGVMVRPDASSDQ